MSDSTRVGRYELLERIGSGGAGEVHLARVGGEAGFEKLVVLKRLLPRFAEDPDHVRQFIDEARLAAGFTHANIVSTFDFGKSEEGYFLTMEYVEGRSLRQLTATLEERGKSLPIPAAVFVVAEVCRGLDHAHGKLDPDGRPLHVVHRDVSPHNVLISASGDVKVADFGIAMSASRDFRTGSGVVKGKLRYMAPEQARGERIDARADQFAAGTILWELLFGIRPMPDDEDSSVLEWATRSEFRKPAGARAVPAELEALLHRATAPLPADRFGSCGELADALARLASASWPGFTRASLGRLVEEELADTLRAERERIGALRRRPGAELPQAVESSGASSMSGEGVSVTTDSGAEAAPPGLREQSETLSKSTQSGPLRGMVVVGDAPPRPPRTPRRGGALAALGFALLAVVGGLQLGGLLPFVGPPAPPATPTVLPSTGPRTTATLVAPSVSETPVPASTSTRALRVTTTPRKPITPVPSPRLASTLTAIPSPTAAVASAMGQGWVSVSVDEATGWAEVWIDGTRVKKDTPLLSHPVGAGTHDIMVLREGRRGVRRVKVEVGQHVRVVLSVERP